MRGCSSAWLRFPAGARTFRRTPPSSSSSTRASSKTCGGAMSSATHRRIPNAMAPGGPSKSNPRRARCASEAAAATLRRNDRMHVGIIGAGPAGLTAAYLLTKQGIRVTVLEADPEYVGGIARTARYKGYHFDIGGHRFFSKAKEVEDLWTEILPDDMLVRPRSSRIYYKGKFFSYPLRAVEALLKLGVFEALP